MGQLIFSYLKRLKFTSFLKANGKKNSSTPNVVPHFLMHSLNDPIDTTSPSGILVFQIFCALAEHERNVIVQRTKAGLESARARGRNGGRPKGLLPAYQEIAESVKELYDAEKQSTTQIMKTFKIESRRTFYKILTFAGVQVKGFTKKRGRKKLNPTEKS